MNKKTVDLLRDPVSQEPLQYRSEGDQSFLMNVASGRRYPVRDGIPEFVAEADMMDLDRKARRFYQVVAPIYDTMIRSYFVVKRLDNEDTFRREYLKDLVASSASRILEVSIGTGTNLRYLPDGCEVFGIDLSWKMLKGCQKNLQRWKRSAELFMANADALPFATDSFDAVMNTGSFKHYANKGRALAEMIRVTRPGGRVLIVDQTNKTASEVLKVPLIGPLFKKLIEVQKPPLDIVPSEMENLAHRLIVDGRFYCLRFDKPNARTVQRPA